MPSHTNKYHCTKNNQYGQTRAPSTDVPPQKSSIRKIKRRENKENQNHDKEKEKENALIFDVTFNNNKKTTM